MADAGFQSNVGLRPRDAATLIVVDGERDVARVLVGRRRPDLVFLPDKYVFPGGRLDKADRYVQPTGELRKTDQEKLLVDMKGKPSVERAQALAMAAIRETYEETGLLIGEPFEAHIVGKQTSSNPVWQKMFDKGVAPSLAGIRFMARAITPPGRTRRFDTRFFCVDARHIVHRGAPLDNELLDLDWYGLAELRMLDLAHITRAIVEDLDEWLESGGNSSLIDRPVPYYYYANGSFERELIKSSPEIS